MRSRAISLLDLARFVSRYDGDPGTSFREAVASYFQVSLRTVESELPRAVIQGALSVTALETRGNPKRYVVTPEYQRQLARGGYRKMADLVNSGDLPRVQPAFFKTLEALGISYENGLAYFASSGVLAFCPICGFARHLTGHRPVEPPICPDHPSHFDEESGEWLPREMISAWSMGLLGDVEPESPPPRQSKSFAEILKEMELNEGRGFGASLDPEDFSPGY